MDTQFDVLGVGIAAVDDLIYVAEYPPVDCKIPVIGRARQGGGPACTAIAAVGSLGGRAAYVARFGGNELSRFIESALRLRGVDTSHVVPDSTGGPYHSVIVVDSSGHRNVFYDPALYKAVAPDDLPASLIQSAKLVLLDHITDPALTPLAEKVRALAVPMLGDIEGYTETAKCLAALMDYLIVPKAWATWATRASDPAEACALLAKTRRLATVVTDAAHGCYCSSSVAPAVRHFPAFTVPVFDSNGCGDTFHGAFAFAIARNFTVDEAIPFASAAAALKAVAAGGECRGWEALPTLEAVLQFLQARLTESGGSELLRKLRPLLASSSR